MMKVLYVFSGERKNKFQGKPGIDFPDTQFYGMNHLSEFGVFAEYKEFEDIPFGRQIKKIIGFRLKHFLMFFASLHYDLVFGISVLYMLPWKKIIKTNTKFIIFNSTLNRVLNTYKPGSFKFKILSSILNEVDGVVFLSQDNLENVVKKFPPLRNRSYFVPMGVDDIFFKPKYEGRDKYFLSVGRDNARDYKTLVEVAKKLPEEEFHFVCLPRNLEGLGEIPANVKVHENLSLEELDYLYNHAKALLLILHDDLYTEGSDTSGPTVLLEAMAVGLPIVASRKGYIRDYIQDGENGIVVDFYDAEGIKKAIAKITDDSFRKALSVRAREKVESTFNTKEMARGLAKVFETVYGKK